MNAKILAPALAGLLLVATAARPAWTEDYPNPQLLVETHELAAWLDDPTGPVDPDLRILDVRPKAAYDAGHIPQALHLSADAVIDPESHVEGTLLPAEVLAAKLGALGIDRTSKVVLYDDKGGFHAARLFWMLEYFGHRKAAVLNGGFPKWQAEGREVSDRVPVFEARTFGLTITPRRLATAEWLLDHRSDPATVVIDVRPPKLFRAGHIPWARSIPWKQNLAEDGTLKPAAELVAHFAAQGVTREKNVAVHCQNGKAAAHSYFALRLLGFPRVRSYDRSWAEWGAADDLPKAAGPQAALDGPVPRDLKL
ncbi:MAG: sulfurtransferase [Kiloniellales bacterium]|nr:sulfurtransferase [Kiloniellales bacterium]